MLEISSQSMMDKTKKAKRSSPSPFFTIIKSDLLLVYRQRSDIFIPLLFFIITVTLFPLAITPETATLKLIAPGVIWVAALLASLLSMDRIFQCDFEEGSCELMILSPQPLAWLVLAKIIAHWCMSGLPILLIAPVLGYCLHLPAHALLILMLTLSLGTPILSLLGSIGVALTIGLARSGLLLALVILPLSIPVLIFATMAVQAAINGFPVSGQCALLAALLTTTLCFAPLASARLLAINVSN